MKLHVVIRTCDRVSLQHNRIVPKDECIFGCLTSLVNSLELSGIPNTLHIIDDFSSETTRDKIKKIAPNATFCFLPEQNQEGLNNKQKSRHSVKVAYDYIFTLPETDLVYIVEDDYLHYANSIQTMIDAYKFFTEFLQKSIGIFPQSFPELYGHPSHNFNKTYLSPCYMFAGPDRYYRTTWFTHESFLVPVSVVLKYKEFFLQLLDIGTIDGYWEGNTISNVWNKPDVMMLMPIETLAIHVSKKEDLPFFNNDFETLWEQNKKYW
jgi:hypothetical protein